MIILDIKTPFESFDIRRWGKVFSHRVEKALWILSLPGFFVGNQRASGT
jgi:hypothetical protein